jgi:DtxR family Mn-dependent transcriptional regulator
VSESVEMYLVMIALLRKNDHQPVPLSLLANKLSISAVSANEMCRKLEERGLVQYQPYKGVILTSEGEAEAQLVLGRRRLWVVFLVEELGIEPDEADQIACELEHITSDKLVGALRTYLEHAPSSTRSRPARNASAEREPVVQPLLNCSAGQYAHIAAIDADAVITDFLHAQGIRPGVSVEVLAVSDNGSLLLGLAEHHLSLARAVASHINITLAVSDTPQRPCTWEKCSAFWSCPQQRVCAHEPITLNN